MNLLLSQQDKEIELLQNIGKWNKKDRLNTLEIFELIAGGGCLQPIRNALTAVKQEILEINKRKMWISRQIVTAKEEDVPYWYLTIEQKNKDIEEKEKEIKKLKMFESKAMGKPTSKGLNIALAKSFPIGDMITTKKGFENSQQAKFCCPLHNENTPSFVWYKEKNKAICYGCSWKGDSIDLYQKLHNCTIQEAIHSLSAGRS